MNAHTLMSPTVSFMDGFKPPDNFTPSAAGVFEDMFMQHESHATKAEQPSPSTTATSGSSVTPAGAPPAEPDKLSEAEWDKHLMLRPEAIELMASFNTARVEATGENFELEIAQHEQSEKSNALRKEAQKWFQSAEEGVDPRSAIGQAFSRDKEGGLSPEYTKGLNRLQKAEFRKNYARMKAEAFSAQAEEITTVSHTDVSLGTYVSIAKLIRDEGVEACKIYLPKMAKLGPPWIRWDDLWERWEVVTLERSHKEEFKRAWELRKNWKRHLTLMDNCKLTTVLRRLTTLTNLPLPRARARQRARLRRL